MKKLVTTLLCCFALTLSTSSFALGWWDVLDAMAKIYGVDLDTKDLNAEEVDQLNQVVGSLSGTHSYGNQNYNRDTYAWGNGANSWQDILAMSRHGGGSGQLGDTLTALAKDYPIQSDFNSPNTTERDYYRLQAQTSLASRSAAELSYQQAVKEEKTMSSLHDLIDKTADEKSASDLNNRLTSEQAMTSVQQTKLLSILVNQQAVQAQERANRAKEDMAFFNNK